MSDQKKELIDLIEAYAASKMTQNETLQRMAIEKVNSFLATIEVVPVNRPETKAPVPAPTAEDETPLI